MSGKPKPQPAAKAPGRVIDLDQVRAARAEVEKEPVTLKVGGEEFTLPPEMPAEFALLSEEGRIREAITALLGVDQAVSYWAQRPSVDDLNLLLEQVSATYGLDEGE